MSVLRDGMRRELARELGAGMRKAKMEERERGREGEGARGRGEEGAREKEGEGGGKGKGESVNQGRVDHDDASSTRVAWLNTEC